MGKITDAILSMHSDGAGSVSWLRVFGSLMALSILVPHAVYAIKNGQPSLAFSNQELQLLTGFGVTKLWQNSQENASGTPPTDQPKT